MRIFVTGATGFIGSVVVADLLAAGHQVLGLARSDAAAEALARAGAAAHRGELTDTKSLAAGARACDGVAHLGFIHDFSQYQENGAIDRRAVAAMADALAGSNKPLVITSGITVVAPGHAVTEDDAATHDSPSAVRTPSEEIVLAAAGRGVRTSVVRLPPTVHGPGDHAFVPALIDIARRTGVSAYIGEGSNSWSAVHRRDAARLFRLALERAAHGTRLHGVAEEAIPVKAIAEAIGAGLDLPVRSITRQEAAKHFDWLAQFIAIDASATSVITRRTLGWQPTENGLLKDLRESGYFS